jgi:hypothetical protein
MPDNDVTRHRAERGTQHLLRGIRGRRKLLLTAALAGCLSVGAGATAAVSGAGHVKATELTATSADRALALDAANRSLDRSAAPTASPSLSPTPKPSPTIKTDPAPVAGLTKTQMHNAAIIVAVARSMGLPKRAMIIGVATSLQECNLYNNASQAVPESLNYPHEGSSVDYDSVGIFQQRTSTGWGTVKNLMNPAYQARNFFNVLKRLDYMHMTLWAAAQTVQVSAYPYAYAKHETRATTIVNAFF